MAETEMLLLRVFVSSIETLQPALTQMEGKAEEREKEKDVGERRRWKGRLEA